MDNNHGWRRLIICIVAVLIIVLAGVFVWADRAAKASMAEQTESIKDTIYDRALQCYVIEGAYPESLDYLVENYGLAVNTEDYRILYKPYAENQPPDVRVIYRGDKNAD
ncbi:MAG: hypothetical protein J6D57_08660 [Mogibacterium sp.]|nr:hypothetical protein [Mogibacterium sp.]